MRYHHINVYVQSTLSSCTASSQGRELSSQRMIGLWFGKILIWTLICWFPTQLQAASSDANIRLGGGDIIFLQADSHKALNRTFKLEKNGSLLIPYIGRINLQGHTVREAEQIIRKRLGSFFRNLQKLTIRVLKRRKSVWIKGWVKRPGRYTLDWKDGLEVLLRKAKGLRQGARIDHIQIRDPRLRKVQIFNLLRYYQTGRGQLPTLGRDNTVFIPVSPEHTPEIGVHAKQVMPGHARIAVLGAVKNPGVFPVFKKINLLQAIAMASGPLAKSGWQEVLITPPRGRTYCFDLKRHLSQPSSGSLLPMLQPGSVVIVPFKPLGRSQKGPVRVLGEVGTPGVWRGSSEKNLTGWLARSKGPTSNADLTAVSVIYKGSNFTINQLVDVKNALRKGELKRLPPTPSGRIVIFVPKKETKSRAAQDTQTILQIAISVTTVVSSVVLLGIALAK